MLWGYSKRQPKRQSLNLYSRYFLLNFILRFTRIIPKLFQICINLPFHSIVVHTSLDILLNINLIAATIEK